MNNWLDFALTVNKRDYNTNDRLKFILPFIRRDNNLNNRLKLIKNEKKGVRKVSKMKMKAYKKRMDHWGCIDWIERFNFENLSVEDRRTTKNERRMAKNFHGISHRNVSKALRKHPDLDFFSSFSSLTNFKWITVHKMLDPFTQPPFPYL